MKKNIKIIFAVLFIVIIILSVVLLKFKTNEKSNSKTNDNNYINIKCTKNTISVGETTDCILSGYSKNDISMFEGQMLNNSKIEISNVKKDSIWVIGVDDVRMQFISDGVKENFDIVKFNVKGKENGDGTITIGELKGQLSFSSKKADTYNLKSITYKIKVK